jgi:DNA-binding transcriptional MerR regulator
LARLYGCKYDVARSRIPRGSRFAVRGSQTTGWIYEAGGGSRSRDRGSRIPVFIFLRYTLRAPCKPGVTTVEIPNRSLFRQPEVCEIAQVQPYVLRTWEAEFPELGVKKTEAGPRVYRRADLEFVLRIKHLLFVEGLTLAGARRKLIDERPAAESVSEGLDELLGSDARERIMLVKRGLKEIAVMLSKTPAGENHGAAQSLLDLVDTKPASVSRSTPARKLSKAPAAAKKKR